MNPDSPAPIAWRKSSYSTSTGNCVEVARATDGMVVRDSKNPAAGTISVTATAWATFLRDTDETR